jgi:hypothetical protein
MTYRPRWTAGIFLWVGPALLAQTHFSGSNITGQLIRLRTVNLLQQAQAQQVSASDSGKTKLRRLLSPSKVAAFGLPPYANGLVTVTSSGFNGLTHYDQREANGGNQFSIEPPSPALAVADGFVLEGVNDAVRVYSVSGSPQLPVVLTSNQVFGLGPAIDRTTNFNGVYLTDMRVFHDPDFDRWIILQWSQANDSFGDPLPQSTEWIAVSQTNNPTGTYNIYSLDTTNGQTLGCPCIPDYPQIGADQNGFYISSNEFPWAGAQFGTQPIDVSVLAISKASLAAGALTPTVYRFAVPFGVTGYEFALQPATTPPGGQYSSAENGSEYLVSSNAEFSAASDLAIWALTNTHSLTTSAPDLGLTEVLLPTEAYFSPNVANQRPGPLPYGSSLEPPGLLPYLDGGDTRLLSLSYSGGLLYATLATEVTNSTTGHIFVGGAYFIISPTLANNALKASIHRQGYVHVADNHLLRPALAINPAGSGAIAVTVVGPDFFPSAAFIPINTTFTSPFLRVAAAGSAPEDGFTGYPNLGYVSQGVARWGDDSAAVVDSSGNIWMSVEYIPNNPRTQLANWGTFIMEHNPSQ